MFDIFDEKNNDSINCDCCHTSCGKVLITKEEYKELILAKGYLNVILEMYTLENRWNLEYIIPAINHSLTKTVIDTQVADRGGRNNE